MMHRMANFAALSFLPALVALSACSSGSSSGLSPSLDGGGAFDSGTQSQNDGSIDDAGRFGPDGGPPSGRVPMTNGAFIYDDGSVAWWNTGAFSVSRGAADPNGSALFGSFQTAQMQGAIDPQLKGRREGDCAMLKGQSTPSFPRKTTEPAGTMTLSVFSVSKATVPPSTEGTYTSVASTSWFQSGNTVQLSFSGGANVPGIAIDIGPAPPQRPSFVAPPSWAKATPYVVTYTPVSEPGNVLLRSSVGSGTASMLLECEALISKGRVEIPLSMRADLEAQWKDVGTGFTFQVLTRSSAWSWSQGWLLFAETVDERGMPQNASTTFVP
jgi:hypothetical protein